MVAAEATRGDDEMGLLDEIASMGYEVRRVEPSKLQETGCLTDAELDELREIDDGGEVNITAAQLKTLEDYLRKEVAYLAKNAASWLFDGNTDAETYRRFRAGLEDGDPEIMDALPTVDWSGQWADGPDWDAMFADAIWDATDHHGSWDEPIPDDWRSLSDDLFYSIGQDYADEVIIAEVERIIAYQLD
jgi:hypothetical protein